MNLIRFFTNIVLLVFAATVTAQVFVRYDENCMARLQYSYAATPDLYLAYQLRHSPDDVLTLDVGSGKNTSKLPANAAMRTCSALLSDPHLVYQINTGQTDLYIVDDRNGTNQVYRALLASRLKTSGGILVYESADIQIIQPIDRLSGGIDLADAGSKFSVFFTGTITSCGLNNYMFHREPRETCYPPGDFQLLSGMGLVQETTITSDNASLYQLTTVNGQDVCTYIHQPVRLITKTDLPPAPTVYNTMVEAPRKKPVAVKTEPVAVQKPVVQQVAKVQEEPQQQVTKTEVIVYCPQTHSPGKHVVQKGETLFSISRKYGLTVSQLKSYNDLQSDTIGLCTVLTVTAPAAYSAVEFTSKTAVAPTVAPAAKPAPAPKPAVKTKTTVTPSTPAKSVTQKVTATKPIKKITPVKPATHIDTKAVYHIAECGETLYGIARRYGYTAERLAQMNKISVQAPIVCGQKLIVNDCACAAPTPTPATTTKTGASTTATLTTKGSTPAMYQQPQTLVVAARQTHVVKEGETLADISRLYNIPAAKLRQINRLDASEIVIPNQVLIVNE